MRQQEEQEQEAPHDFDTLIKPFELTTGGLAKLLEHEIEITTQE